MNFSQWFNQYAASRDWAADTRERFVAEAAWDAGRYALREELRAERNDPTSEPLAVATATLDAEVEDLVEAWRRENPEIASAASDTTLTADALQAEELTAVQARAAGYDWCPACRKWVPRSEVTVDEHHEACGAYVACFPGARWAEKDHE